MTFEFDTGQWCLQRAVEYDSFDDDVDAIWQDGRCEECGGEQQLVCAVVGISPRTDASRSYRLTELDGGFPAAQRANGITSRS